MKHEKGKNKCLYNRIQLLIQTREIIFGKNKHLYNSDFNHSRTWKVGKNYDCVRVSKTLKTGKLCRFMDYFMERKSLINLANRLVWKV